MCTVSTPWRCPTSSPLWIPPPGPALEQVLGQHTLILLPDLGNEFGGFSCAANYANLNDELDKTSVCACKVGTRIFKEVGFRGQKEEYQYEFYKKKTEIGEIFSSNARLLYYRKKTKNILTTDKCMTAIPT